MKRLGAVAVVGACLALAPSTPAIAAVSSTGLPSIGALAPVSPVHPPLWRVKAAAKRRAAQDRAIGLRSRVSSCRVLDYRVRCVVRTTNPGYYGGCVEPYDGYYVAPHRIHLHPVVRFPCSAPGATVTITE